MSKKFKKIFSIMLTILMLIPLSTPVLSYSYENSNIKFEYEEKEIDDIAKLLELYFSRLGYIDKKGNYIVTDYELLEKLDNKGDLFAKKLKYSNHQVSRLRSLKGLGQCVFNEYFGPFIKFINGSYLKSFERALLQQSWRQAGGILARALSEVSKKVGYKVSGAFAIAELGYYVYLCRSHI